jgi:hypothetical protein
MLQSLDAGKAATYSTTAYAIPSAKRSLSFGVSFGFDLTGATPTNTPPGEQPAQRSVPPTRYSDVLGQNAAVETARDLSELPLKHADLFLRIGAKP